MSYQYPQDPSRGRQSQAAPAQAPQIPQTTTLLDLNSFDRNVFNVLMPVTKMAAQSDLQRVMVNVVTLDCRQDQQNKGPSNVQREECETEIADLKTKLAKSFTTDLDSLISKRKQITEQITSISSRQGAIAYKLDQIEAAEEQAAQLRREKDEYAGVLTDYQTLVKAFGLDGIRYMIVRSIVPEIMQRSNEILAAMTGGRMAVDIRTEREKKSDKKIVNSLEVWIHTLAGGNRPYQSHSGGEKVKIALAVTLGLADVKARRAGVQLGMLFIDEPPFLDADGTDAYADALTAMAARNPDMRILAISHDPTMKARFPQNITVTGGENGSSVTME